MRSRSLTYSAFALAFLVLGTAATLHARIVFSNTQYTLTLHEDGHVAHMQVSTEEYTNWSYGNDAFEDRTTMTHRVYSHFNDVFDFMFIVDNEDELLAPFFGRHVPVKNDVEGIGKSVFDNSSSYGSTGMLYSLIHLAKNTTIEGGPSLHEMMHRWGNSLSAVPSEVSGHWGYSSANGQLGGWDPLSLTNLGGQVYDANGPLQNDSWGSFANGGNAVPYSDLEMYTAGWISSNEVTNAIDIAQGFAWSNSSQGIFSATNFLSVSIQDIITADGDRVPAAGTAPTNFRGIVVILSDQPLNDSELDAFNEACERFGRTSGNLSSTYNFWEATGGRAQLKLDNLTGELLGAPPILSVSGSEGLHAEGAQGGPFVPADITYTLSNSYASSISWTAIVSGTWIESLPHSGSLAPGSSIDVTVQFSSAADLLAPGQYEGQVSFLNPANGSMVSRSASLAIQGFATLPFTEDFESGTLSGFWQLSGTEQWRTEISTNWNPHGGSRHLVMDDSISGGNFSRNEATLGLNLLGYSNVELRVWVQDYFDESHLTGNMFTNGANTDGIAISTNGVDWYLAEQLTTLDDTNYTEVVIDLSFATEFYGLEFSDRYLVRLNHYDNFSIDANPSASDGLTFDDITITGDLSDRDGDGMSDIYEDEYNLDPDNPADAGLDPDNDLFITLYEYLADTDPTNGSSFLWLESIQSTNDQEFIVAFPSSPNRVYNLFISTNLGLGNWSLYSTNLPGNGSTITIPFNGNPDDAHFRIETWR